MFPKFSASTKTKLTSALALVVATTLSSCGGGSGGGYSGGTTDNYGNGDGNSTSINQNNPSSTDTNKIQPPIVTPNHPNTNLNDGSSDSSSDDHATEHNDHSDDQGNSQGNNQPGSTESTQNSQPVTNPDSQPTTNQPTDNQPTGNQPAGKPDQTDKPSEKPDTSPTSSSGSQSGSSGSQSGNPSSTDHPTQGGTTSDTNPHPSQSPSTSKENVGDGATSGVTDHKSDSKNNDASGSKTGEASTGKTADESTGTPKTEAPTNKTPTESPSDSQSGSSQAGDSSAGSSAGSSDSGKTSSTDNTQTGGTDNSPTGSVDKNTDSGEKSPEPAQPNPSQPQAHSGQDNPEASHSPETDHGSAGSQGKTTPDTEHGSADSQGKTSPDAGHGTESSPDQDHTATPSQPNAGDQTPHQPTEEPTAPNHPNAGGAGDGKDVGNSEGDGKGKADDKSNVDGKTTEESKATEESKTSEKDKGNVEGKTNTGSTTTTDPTQSAPSPASPQTSPETNKPKQPDQNPTDQDSEKSKPDSASAESGSSHEDKSGGSGSPSTTAGDHQTSGDGTVTGKDGASQNNASQDSTSQDSTSQGGVSKDSTDQDGSSKNSTDQESPNPAGTDQGTAGQDHTGKDSAGTGESSSQPTTPEQAGKGETGKENTSSPEPKQQPDETGSEAHAQEHGATSDPATTEDSADKSSQDSKENKDKDDQGAGNKDAGTSPEAVTSPEAGTSQNVGTGQDKGDDQSHTDNQDHSSNTETPTHEGNVQDNNQGSAPSGTGVAQPDKTKGSEGTSGTDGAVSPNPKAPGSTDAKASQSPDQNSPVEDPKKPAQEQPKDKSPNPSKDSSTNQSKDGSADQAKTQPTAGSSDGETNPAHAEDKNNPTDQTTTPSSPKAPAPKTPDDDCDEQNNAGSMPPALSSGSSSQGNGGSSSSNANELDGGSYVGSIVGIIEIPIDTSVHKNDKCHHHGKPDLDGSSSTDSDEPIPPHPDDIDTTEERENTETQTDVTDPVPAQPEPLGDDPDPISKYTDAQLKVGIQPAINELRKYSPYAQATVAQKERLQRNLKRTEALEFVEFYQRLQDIGMTSEGQQWLQDNNLNNYIANNVKEMEQRSSSNNGNIYANGHFYSFKQPSAKYKMRENVPQFLATGFFLNASPFYPSLPYATSYPIYNGKDRTHDYTKKANLILRLYDNVFTKGNGSIGDPNNASEVNPYGATVIDNYKILDPLNIVMQYSDSYNGNPSSGDNYQGGVNAAPQLSAKLPKFLTGNAYNPQGVQNFHPGWDDSPTPRAIFVDLHNFILGNRAPTYGMREADYNPDNYSTGVDYTPSYPKDTSTSGLQIAPISVFNVGGSYGTWVYRNGVSAYDLINFNALRSKNYVHGTDYNLDAKFIFQDAQLAVSKAIGRCILTYEGEGKPSICYFTAEEFNADPNNKKYGMKFDIHSFKYQAPLEGLMDPPVGDPRYAQAITHIISSNGLNPYYVKDYDSIYNDAVGFGGFAAVTNAMLDRRGLALTGMFGEYDDDVKHTISRFYTMYTYASADTHGDKDQDDPSVGSRGYGILNFGFTVPYYIDEKDAQDNVKAIEKFNQPRNPDEFLPSYDYTKDTSSDLDANYHYSNTYNDSLKAAAPAYLLKTDNNAGEGVDTINKDSALGKLKGTKVEYDYGRNAPEGKAVNPIVNGIEDTINAVYDPTILQSRSKYSEVFGVLEETTSDGIVPDDFYGHSRDKFGSSVYDGSHRIHHTPLAIFSSGEYNPAAYVKYLSQQNDDNIITQAITSKEAGWGVDASSWLFHLIYDKPNPAPQQDPEDKNPHTNQVYRAIADGRSTHKTDVDPQHPFTNYDPEKPTNFINNNLIVVTGAYYDLDHRFERAQFNYKLQALQLKHSFNKSEALDKVGRNKQPYKIDEMKFMHPKDATISALGSLQCGAVAQYCLTAPYNIFYHFPGTASHDISVELYGGSIASSIVSGIAANVLQVFPWFSSENLQTTLLTTATDIGKTGIDRTYGWGMVNFDRARLGPAQFAFRDFDADMTGYSSTQQSENFLINNYRDKGENYQPTEAGIVPYLSVFANDISGSHGLRLRGRGDSTLVLSGYNTYTGDTTVDSGILVVSPLDTPKYHIQTLLPDRFSDKFIYRDNDAPDGFRSQLNSKITINHLGVVYLNQTHILKDIDNGGRLFLDNTVHIDGSVKLHVTPASALHIHFNTIDGSKQDTIIKPIATDTPHNTSYLYYQKLTNDDKFTVQIDKGITVGDVHRGYYDLYLDFNWFLHQNNPHGSGKNTLSANTPYVIFQTHGHNRIKGRFNVTAKLDNSFSNLSVQVQNHTTDDKHTPASRLVVVFNTGRHNGNSLNAKSFYNGSIVRLASAGLQASIVDRDLVVAGGNSVIGLIDRDNKIAQPLLDRYFGSQGQDQQAYLQLTANSHSTGNVLAGLTQPQLQQLAYSQSGTMYSDLQLVNNSQSLDSINNFISSSAHQYLQPKAFAQARNHAYASYTYAQTTWARDNSAITGQHTVNGTAVGFYGQYQGLNYGVSGYYNQSNWNETLDLSRNASNPSLVSVVTDFGKAKAYTTGLVATLGRAYTHSFYSVSVFGDFSHYTLTRQTLDLFGKVKGEFNNFNGGLDLRLGGLAWSSSNLGLSLYSGATVLDSYQAKFTETAAQAQAQDLSFKVKAKNHINAFVQTGASFYSNFNVLGLHTQFTTDLALVQALTNQDFNLDLNNPYQTTTAELFSNRLLAKLKLGYKVLLTKNLSLKLSGSYNYANNWDHKQVDATVTYNF